MQRTPPCAQRSGRQSIIRGRSRGSGAVARRVAALGGQVGVEAAAILGKSFAGRAPRVEVRRRRPRLRPGRPAGRCRRWPAAKTCMATALGLAAEIAIEIQDLFEVEEQRADAPAIRDRGPGLRRRQPRGRRGHGSAARSACGHGASGCSEAIWGVARPGAWTDQPVFQTGRRDGWRLLRRRCSCAEPRSAVAPKQPPAAGG